MGWRFATAQSLVKNPKDVQKKTLYKGKKKKKTVQGEKSALA
jgi:hypothetical protein